MSTIKELVCQIDFYASSGDDIVGKIARYILKKAEINSDRGFSNEEALDIVNSLHPRIDRRLYDMMLREAIKILNDHTDVNLSDAALAKYKEDIREHNFKMDKKYQISDDIIGKIDERRSIIEKHLAQVSEKYWTVVRYDQMNKKLMSLESVDVGRRSQGEIV
jgi:hypothetical protein